ncbi:MAG: helix-turn-helix domain-containing protein, partial [Nocardiopsaceae bacterium]|nr:helix-turn-helix domain-containing protein [Nocardiopsaceae bacterium]
MSEDRRFTVPLFTIEEAAHHLGLPRTTLKDWTHRYAGPAPLVHGIFNPDAPRAASLPFVAVIEAHMLRGFRQLGLSAQGLRDSVASLRTILDDEYALATRQVAT